MDLDGEVPAQQSCCRPG